MIENESCRLEGDFQGVIAVSLLSTTVPQWSVFIFSSSTGFCESESSVRFFLGHEVCKMSVKMLVSTTGHACMLSNKRSCNLLQSNFSDQTLPLDVYGQEKHPDSEKL